MNKKRHRRIWRQLGLLFIVMVVIPYFFGDIASKNHLDAVLQAPSLSHWFGTDAFGRDVFFRVWNAGSVSIGLSVMIMGISYGLGLLLGAVAGYVGGVVDRVISFLLDVFLAFPSLLIAICVAGVMGGGMLNGAFALVLVYTPYYAKLARTQMKQLGNADFLTATYMSGAPLSYRILSLLNHIQTPLLAYASINIGSIILGLATLSFLGIGVTVPQAEWGAMLNEGRNVFEQAPWLVFFPGLAVTGTILYLNKVGHKIQHMLGGI